ncbi:Protein phosphatase PP2A regulatory subunit B [Coemansia sp. RSA 2610]|nr:Protein phosphatase PP2A regulatory subunit B [Coemansia sp. RSA 2610]
MLTAAQLASAPPEERKQMLGELLYPRILAVQPENAGKITGMLLEMDDSDLLGLLDEDEKKAKALDEKINEAMQVLSAQGPEESEDAE